ncbi:MAG: hypothetical protein ACKVHN_07095 [Candidatus Poseidoniales archaeon]|jgi:hypothetical protein
MTDNNLQVAAKNPQFETSNELEVKQRIRSILKFGQQYDIYLPGIEAPAGYCHRGLNWPWSACDLKFYADETKTTELLHIKQRNWVDAWGTFDLFDSSNGEHICTFKRKYWAGFLQRTWMVTDPAGQELFQIQEDNIMKSIIRRVGGAYIPFMDVILRTNLNFRTLDGKTDFGAFNRKFSLRDRYTVIRTSQELDGRILWAAGPLLDNAGGR